MTMAAEPRYQGDVDAILARRQDQGWDLWTTPDQRLMKGAPFSTLECVSYLLELGMERDAPVLRDAAALILGKWQADGRFRLYPKGSIYPCQTAWAAVVLCRMGYAADERVRKTLAHLLDTRHGDGGLRCNKFFFGHGPETEHSNPFPTLLVLDAFRYADWVEPSALDCAVEFLLSHWETRLPIGPCHYGIGTRFMQVSYPFRDYNLFYYVYVLSFYARARGDARFRQALDALTGKTADGQIVTERLSSPRLKGLAFCEKGAPSAPATRQYREILQNVGMA